MKRFIPFKGFISFCHGWKNGMHLFSARMALLVEIPLFFLVYFFGVGLSSCFGKLMGKKFLTLTIDKKAVSYWEDLDLKKKPIKDYTRQF